ncbi:MAG TPA: carboxypeptidase-like regulatory domain-containing protein [Symbiobacteriaceae bacterium]|jgi:hypothetical protein
MPKRLLALLTIAFCLMLSLPAAAAGRSSSLTVGVTGDLGAALAGARVELIAPGAGTVASGITNAAGRATLKPAAYAPTFWVRVWGPNHTTVDKPWVPAVDGAVLTVALAPLQGRLTGLVTDQLGTPVPGAAVTVWGQATGLTAEAMTGADGTYTVDGLPAPGPYLVQVTFAGYRPFVSAFTPVTAGRGKQVDATLLPLTATIAGQVVDARLSDPVSGARVELIRKGFGILDATQTDGSGQFSFTAPAADTPDYTVRVWASTFSPSVSPAFALAGGARQEFTGPARLMVAKDPILFRTVTVSGVVEDDQGVPLEGAAVTLYRANGLLPQAVTTSAADGSYSFVDQDVSVKTGYTVEAAKDGYFTGSDGQTVLVVDNYTTARTNLRLRPATARLQGHLTNCLGLPAAGGRVTVLNLRDGSTASATADSKGAYSISNLPAGPADVVVVRGSARSVADGGEVLNGDGPVSLAGLRARTANLQLAPVGSVTGIIFGPDGWPVAGATISLWHEGAVAPAATVLTGTDGSYAFGSLKPGERYAVSAAADGYTPSSLAPGEPTVTPLFKASPSQAIRLDLGLTN